MSTEQNKAAGSPEKEQPTTSAAQLAAQSSATVTEQQVVVARNEGGNKAVPQASDIRNPTMADRPSPPLSLEHATPDSVPLHVLQLLSHYEQCKLPQTELMVLLIYLVALECGYVEEQTFAQKRHLLKMVPAVGCYHAGNVQLLTSLPANYAKQFEGSAYSMELRTLVEGLSSEESVVTALKSRLLAVVLGDLLMVTLSPKLSSTEPGHSICLPIAHYILNMQLKDKPLFNRLRHMDEFCYHLRQKVFQPMRAQQLSSVQVHRQPTLLGLPDELYEQIFDYFNNNQLNVVANVNRRLNYHSKRAKHRRQRFGSLRK